MEIRVEETLTGKQLREKILAEYGSRERLVAAAGRPRGQEAREDLAQLELLDAEPRRLLDTVQTTTISRLAPGDLARITEKRIELYQFLARRKDQPNLTELSAKLGRDKKHISEDLRVLEELGFLRIDTQGKSLRPKILGNDVHITNIAPA